MAETFKILGIAGSLRAGSYNRGLLTACVELAPPELRIEAFDLAGLPIYNYDLEVAGVGPAVIRLHEAVRAADAMLIASPENNGFPAAVTVNAISWLSRPPTDRVITAKRSVIMGVTSGRGATKRMQPRLRDLLTGATAGAVMAEPELGIAEAGNKFDAAGRLTDEATRAEIAGFLAAFVQWLSKPPA